MKNPLKKAYEFVAPNPEDLWKRSGANPSEGEVPLFDLDTLKKDDVEAAKNGRIIDHNNEEVGDYFSFSIETSDGIDRTARVYIPDDDRRSSSDMVLHADTAWLTTITGHNDYAASKFVSQTGLPMIVVGAEHGTNREQYPKELLRLGQTAIQSTGISLAKSAQSSQLISSYLQEKFDLPTNMLKTGESRGAMLTPAHLAYAEMYGNKILYSDTTAPCMPTKLFSERGDSIRLAAWMGFESMGGLALGLDILRQQALKRRLGTVAFNPNFMVSNVIGVGPALFSGEFGEFSKWVPQDAAMYYSTFKNDLFTKPAVLRDLYKDHPNVYIRTHKSGTHATLANDKVIDAKSMRFNAFQTLYADKGESISSSDLRVIYEMRPDQSYGLQAAA